MVGSHLMKRTASAGWKMILSAFIANAFWWLVLSVPVFIHSLQIREPQLFPGLLLQSDGSSLGESGLVASLFGVVTGFAWRDRNYLRYGGERPSKNVELAILISALLAAGFWAIFLGPVAQYILISSTQHINFPVRFISFVGGLLFGLAAKSELQALSQNGPVSYSYIKRVSPTAKS